MFFILSISLLFVFILLITSLHNIRSFLDWVLALGVYAFAAVVLLFQVANLLHKINSIPVVLGLQFFLLVLGLGGWWASGRPELFPHLPRIPGLISLLKKKENWPVVILGGTVVASLALYAVLIYVVPPNNNDVLSIHLARVANWLQRGSYFPWAAQNIWEVTFPVNAQLLYTWTLLFTRGDHFVAYLPYFAGILIAIQIFQICKSIKLSTKWSFLAALIWLSFPVVQLHLTSARQDLVSTWLFLTSLYFLFKWLFDNEKGGWVLSAVSFALVLGTNFSIAAFIPGFMILLVLMVIKKKMRMASLFSWGFLALFFFIVLSSPIYISNFITFGSPVGPDLKEMTSSAVTNELPLGRYLGINSGRWMYQMLDFSGLPQPVVVAATKGKAVVVDALAKMTHVEMEGDIATLADHAFYWDTTPRLQEDEAWFGLVGFGLIVPTSIAAFIVGIKKKNYFLGIPLLFLVTSLIACSLIRPGWTPYDGRYFMPLAAICTPLVALWKPKKGQGWLIQIVVVLLSVSSVLMVILFNPAKQIVGGSAIWGMNRIDMLTRQSYNSKGMLYLVEDVIPTDAVVGVATNGADYPQYGIFGEHFTRKVIDILPGTELTDQAWLQQNQIDYLLILKTDDFPGQIAPDYHFLDGKGDWMVYTNQP